MIAVDDLHTVREIVGGQIPDPVCAIGGYRQVSSLWNVVLNRQPPPRPAAVAGEGWRELVARIQYPGVSHIDPVREFHPLVRLWVALWAHFHVVDGPDFELFPAFVTNMHLAAVYADALALVTQYRMNWVGMVKPGRRQDRAFHGNKLTLGVLIALEPFAAKCSPVHSEVRTALC